MKLLIFTAYVFTVNAVSLENLEPSRLDGWYTNFHQPAYGAVLQPFARAISHQTPSKLVPVGNVSLAFRGGDGKEGSKFTALFAHFGQAALLEMMPEFLTADNIACPIGKNFFATYKTSCTGNNTGQQCRTEKHDSYLYNVAPINPTTPLIDGSFIYSTSEATLSLLRSFKNGSLLVDKDDMPLKNSQGMPLDAPPRVGLYDKNLGVETVSDIYALGSPEANQNVPLLTLAILMHRYHNAMARSVLQSNASLSDEDVFQIARKKTIAAWQNVVMNEYFGHLFGNLQPYKGYDPTSNPQISIEFLAIAPVLKTMVPFSYSVYTTTDCRWKPDTHSLCSEWWDAASHLTDSSSHTIDLTVRGLMSQTAEPIDGLFSAALTDYLFGGLGDTQRDLIAITLQRARDLGAPSYNAARVQFGMSPITSWAEFPALQARNRDVAMGKNFVETTGLLRQHNETTETSDVMYSVNILEQLPNLERLFDEYNASTDDIDLLIGVLLEIDNGTFGPVAKRIFTDQLTRIRDGDRFWFENDAFFSKEERQEIRAVTFSHVVNVTTSGIVGEQDVFLIEGVPAKCRVPSEADPSVCGAYHSYDFFSRSAPAYIVSVVVILLTPIVCFAIIYWIKRSNQSILLQIPFYGGVLARKRRSEYGTMAALDFFIAFEKTSPSTRRRVHLDLSAPSTISIYSRDGSLLRRIKYKPSEGRVPKVIRGLDAAQQQKLNEYLLLVQIDWEWDLVISFDDTLTRNKFIRAFESQLAAAGIRPEANSQQMTNKHILQQATFHQDRKDALKLFFESAFSEMTNGKLAKSTKMEEARKLKINISEFADVLQLRPESHFVKKMFEIADLENRGSIGYGDFVAVLGLLYKGKFEDKMSFVFSMYDENQDGKLTRTELRHMITSIYEVVGMRDPGEASTSSSDVNALLDRYSINERQDIGVDDFVQLMHGNRRSFLEKSESIGLRDRLESTSQPETSAQPAPQPEPKVAPCNHRCTMLEKFQRSNEIYRRQIFIYFLVASMSLVIFVKVFFDFAYFTEQKTQRRVMGNWLAAAKGSGAAIWFILGLIFLSVSKHVLTALNSTILSNYVPFHSAVDFHKFVAWLLYFYAGVHVISHLVNFYELSTQPPEVIQCVYPKYLFPSDYMPTFGWYLYKTRVGLTGFLVTILFIVMLVFALPFVRALTFRAFWITHHLYPAAVMLLIVHGCMGNFKLPQFYLMVVIPLAIYAIDWVFHLRAKGSRVQVAQATALPSEVTHLCLNLPPTFSYTSGQWVRICCPDISPHEYHPFTIASAPCQGRKMDLYIRAVGPWTKALRRIVAGGEKIPRVIMHGPYGSVHQDWYRFQTVVLVGSGIGVTPHASVLRDLVFKAKMGGVITKKVHFLWLSRNHKHFEWFVDILREVESQDTDDVISINIHVTQLMKDYDVRTMMLYMCENNFHQLAGKSIFTGLKARILFHRPNFTVYFRKIVAASPGVSQIGVFTCGGKPVVHSVDQACTLVNNSGGRGTTLVAHEEVF